MGLWIEENLPALFAGAGLGAGTVHVFVAGDIAIILGALAGIGVALPIWQIMMRRKS